MEIHIKTPTKYNFLHIKITKKFFKTLTTSNAGKIESNGNSHIYWEHKMLKFTIENQWQFPKKLNIYLSCVPGILLLGIY